MQNKIQKGKSKPMSPKAGFTKKKRRYEDGGNLKR